MELRFQPVSAPAAIDPTPRSNSAATGAEQLFGPWFQQRLNQTAPESPPKRDAAPIADKSDAPARNVDTAASRETAQPPTSPPPAPENRTERGGKAHDEPRNDNPRASKPTEDEKHDDEPAAADAEADAVVAVAAAATASDVDALNAAVEETIQSLDAEKKAPDEAKKERVVDAAASPTAQAKSNDRRAQQAVVDAATADSTPDQLSQVDKATKDASTGQTAPVDLTATKAEEAVALAPQQVAATDSPDADAPTTDKAPPLVDGQRRATDRPQLGDAASREPTPQSANASQVLASAAPAQSASEPQLGSESRSKDDRRQRGDARRTVAVESVDSKPEAAAAAEPSTVDAGATGAEALDAAPQIDAQNVADTVDSVAPTTGHATNDGATSSSGASTTQDRAETSSRSATGPEHRTNAAEVSRARFVQRVAGAFQAALDRGAPVRLRLSPAELGSLKIEISIRQGVMTARVEAESASARAMLLEGLPQLRDRLAEQNVKIERFDVELSNQSPTDPRQPNDGHTERWQQRPGGIGRAGANGRAGVVETAPSSDRGRTLDASLNVVV